MRLLYDDIKAFAQEKGYTALVCAVNTRPDTLPPQSFHQAFGFYPCENRDIPEKGEVLHDYHKLIFL